MINCVVTSYLLLAFLSYIIVLNREDKRLFYSNNFLIALISSILLFIQGPKYFVAWYHAYLPQLFDFEHRLDEKLAYLKLTLLSLALVLSLFNYRSNFRKKVKYQILLWSLFLGVFVLSIVFQETNVKSAGWHTTIYDQYVISDYLLVFILGLAINTFIVTFKLIPELKDKRVA